MQKMKITQRSEVQNFNQSRLRPEEGQPYVQGYVSRLSTDQTDRLKKQKRKKQLFVIFTVMIIVSLLVTNIFLFYYRGYDAKPNIAGVANYQKFSDVTAILLMDNSPQQGLRSIQNLLTHSQFTKIIVAADYKVDDGILKKFSYIQWLIQKRPEFDVYTLDSLISKVETKYFFLANTQWSYGDNSLIEYSLKVLHQFPDVVQVIPNLEKLPSKSEIGFSLLPGVHRKKDYLRAKEGYIGITRGSLNSKYVENKISEFYLKQNMYAISSRQNFKIQKFCSQTSKKITNMAQKVNIIQINQQQKKPSQKQFFEKQKASQKQPKNNFKIATVTSETSLQQQQNVQNLFTDNFRNARNFQNLQEYLQFNGVSKVLALNCDATCSKNYQRKQKLKMAKLDHISQIIPIQGVKPQYFDWASSQNQQNFINSYVLTNYPISKYVKYGFSLRWPDLEYNKQNIQQIIQYFKANGFYFDQVKSLSFRQIQNKLILIFIKGIKANKNPIQSLSPKNILAIQTVIKIKQDLPFLKEWMAYHINLGFDKFFLYDNSNSVLSPNQPKMTSSRNKYGMDYSCIGMTKEKIKSEWQKLWSEFYDFIVYIKFQPKDESGAIIFDSLKAQQQYIKYYKNVAKYTLFIETDELMFSPKDKNLVQTLKQYQNKKITSLKIPQRHFVNRFCAKNQRMTDISYYFPQTQNRLWDAKLLVLTSSFLPIATIQDGRTNKGKQIIISSNQLRINHYNFQKDGLDDMRKNFVSIAQKFAIDNSAHRYKHILDKFCKNQCSQRFAVSCSSDFEWNNCLDISKQYPFKIEELKKIPSWQSQQEITQKQKPKTSAVKKIPNSKQIRIPFTSKRNTPASSPPKKVPSQPNNYLSKVQANLKPTQKIYQIGLIQRINLLPFCLVVLPSKMQNKQVLMSSINRQDYSNLVTINVPAMEQSTQNDQTINYYYYKSQIYEKCKPNSLTMFITVPLQYGALKKLNFLMQKYKAYIVYCKTSEYTEVLAFYPRIYELLKLNDFKKSNQPFLKNNNRQVLTLGMLQLSSLYALEIDKSTIFDHKEPTYFSIKKQNFVQPARTPYKRILRLSQDTQINSWHEKGLAIVGQLKQNTKAQLTSKNMFRALDRQQLWYLPEGHSIQQLEYEQYSQKYKINQYSDISKQVRFCITILSHNNVQNNRYIKVMKSIVEQKYNNYHIVFIDDFSTDNNMQATIDYMNSINFPKQKITYVQNLKRNFATYNILNAGYNYCDVDDLQMLMDGDDEFIGKYAFQVMNSFFQDPQNWVAYSNYKTNFYDFGRSRQLYSEQDHAVNGKRLFLSVFGAIRTWRVKILYHIPDAYHKMENGQWLDTVYDDALSHPLFELCTVKRMKYVPELLYEYNMNYGDNDDSTKQKIKHRLQTYKYVLSMKMLQPLKSLQGSQKDKDVEKQLVEDYNVKYKIVKAG